MIFGRGQPLSHLNGSSQLVVDGVSAVLDGDGAAALAPGYYGDGFTAVAAQRKQKRIEFLVVGFDTADDIFFSLFGMY